MIEFSIQKKLSASNGNMLLQISGQIPAGQLLCLYGPSGAGKTTVLRILAGLAKADEGHIVVNGSTWLDTKKGIHLSPQKRQLGFVFQDYALFPNMTVKENLLFAANEEQGIKMTEELIEIMELGDLITKKPTKLSGGQQQRVAVARALVQRPKILLLDEPLSALDFNIRKKLQDYILQVHQNYELTTILVSHDIPEILKMADQIIHIENGKVIATGTAHSVLQQLDNVTLIGIIESIENQDSPIINVRIGENTIQVSSTKGQIKELQIGDTIKLLSTLVQTNIKKL